MRKIQLDLRRDLPKVREAFTKGELQYQKGERPNGYTCSYQGPCGIGAMMTSAERYDSDRAYDDGLASDTTIGGLIKAGLVEVPEDQVDDFRNLQRKHDRLTHEVQSELPLTSANRQFEELLTELEAKYGH